MLGVLVGAEHAPAQQTNKPRRVFSYTSRIHLVDTPATLAAPVNKAEEAMEPEDKTAGLVMNSVETPALHAVPPRRVSLKKDQDRDNVPWILPPPQTGDTNGRPVKVSGWGWLVDEVEALRKYSDPIFNEQEPDAPWAAKSSSAAEANDPGRAHIGLVSDHGFQPALPLDMASNRMEQVVSDRSFEDLKRLKTEPPRQTLDLARRPDRLADMSGTIETLGLARITPGHPTLEGQALQKSPTLLSEMIKPYMADMAGGMTLKNPSSPLLAAPTAAPSRLASDALKTATSRWTLPGNTPFEVSPPAAASHSPADTAVTPGTAPHALQPVSFTPTTLYASPLNILPPAGASH